MPLLILLVIAALSLTAVGAFGMAWTAGVSFAGCFLSGLGLLLLAAIVLAVVMYSKAE